MTTVSTTTATGTAYERPVRCARMVAMDDAKELAAARITRLAPSHSSGFCSRFSSTRAVG